MSFFPHVFTISTVRVTSRDRLEQSKSQMTQGQLRVLETQVSKSSVLCLQILSPKVAKMSTISLVGTGCLMLFLLQNYFLLACVEAGCPGRRCPVILKHQK